MVLLETLLFPKVVGTIKNFSSSSLILIDVYTFLFPDWKFLFPD